MKIRKILFCALALSLLGGATVGANELFQTYQGKDVKVFVNGSEVPGGALNIDGKTYVPIRAMSNTLQAIINAGSDTVQIYKPNVHLLLFTGDKNAMKPFGNVYQGSYEFSVFAQVDNLQTEIHSLKTEIVAPNGQTVDFQVYEMSDDIKDVFWYTTLPFNINFTMTGEYKLKFYIKQKESGPFELLSEKAIVSMKKG